jgi:hypothetical protein
MLTTFAVRASTQQSRCLGRRAVVLRPALQSLVIFGIGVLASTHTLGAQVADPRGPVAGWQGKTRLSAEGVQSVGFHYTPPPANAPWQPVWIWTQPGVPASNVPAAHLRKTFTLPANVKVTSALARVSADRIYRLWVNGTLVARGPTDPGSDVILSHDWSHQWLYDQVDLAPYLHAGRNVIAAEVMTTHLLQSYSLGHSGFAFEATIQQASGAPVLLASGPDWRAQVFTGYSEGPILAAPVDPKTGAKPSGLLYDASREQPDWREPAFADTTWTQAVAVESVWGTLQPSRIPFSMELVWPAQGIARANTQVRPTPSGGVRLTGDGSFSIDYDRMLAAYVSLRVHGAAGTRVTLESEETKTNPRPRRAAQLTLSGGDDTFEYPAYDAFSSLRVTVANSSGPVDFTDIRATFTSQPVSYRGSFTSSDESLNQLWQSSRWLTQICMQNRYLDSPNHQEPIGDPGDYLIEQLENDDAFAQPWLIRQDLTEFAAILDHADMVNFHTSYSLLWLQTLINFYERTGDKALLAQLKPTVDRLLDRFATFRGADGLLSEAPNYMFMDWVTIAGFPAHHPPAVIGTGYLTAFYYQALHNAQLVARVMGDQSRAEQYEQLRRQIHVAFERELWDPAAGLYRDGLPNHNHQPLGKWLPADKDISTHSVQMNALAVLYDLAPTDRQATLLQTLFSAQPLNVQPYFMHFVFAAEVHAGVFERFAFEQLRRWKINPETRTFSEMFNGGDFSHGWGGTPLVQLSEVVLGVKPAATAYARIAVAPHPGTLRFARGVVPTEAGDVHVNWTRTDDTFQLDIASPAGSPLEVALPQSLSSNATLSVDGKPTPVPAGQAAVVLPGGTHRLLLTKQARQNATLR